MTRPSQKAAEREIVERLLSAIGLSAEIDADGEKPDIILKAAGRTIGLEVTTYQSGKTVSVGGKRKFTQREVEAAWERFECTSKSFRNERSDLTNVSIIFWFKNIIPPEDEYLQFFIEINDFIVLYRSALSEKFTLYSFHQFTSPLMVKYLMHIAANIHESGEWDSNKTSGFEDRPANAIARIIADKICKVKSYRKTNEMWLVIERSGRPSETVLPIRGIAEFNENPEIRDNLTNGPFLRVYVFTAMGLFQWDRPGEWQNV